MNGLNCTGFHERKRAQYISYIPQQHSKMQVIAVRDVVLMSLNPHLGLLNFPTASNREIATAALMRMGVKEFVSKDFSHLSQGQKQMVFLARTLLQNAPVMLMDEPDSALDFLNHHRMLARLKELIHSEKKAGVITLHDPNFALAYCDRLFLLHDSIVIDQIRTANASQEKIRACLSKIYEIIELLRYNGKYVIMQQCD